MENKQSPLVTTLSELAKYGIKQRDKDKSEFCLFLGGVKPELPVSIEIVGNPELRTDEESLLTLGRVSVQLAILELSENMDGDYSIFRIMEKVARQVVKVYGERLKSLTPPTVIFDYETNKMIVSLGYPMIRTTEELYCLVQNVSIVTITYSKLMVQSYIQATVESIGFNCKMVEEFTAKSI